MDIFPQKQRETLVQLLYSLEESKSINDDSINHLMSVFQLSKKKMNFVIERVKMIFEGIEDIDRQISEISEEYDFERISKVDLAILRVVLYELLKEDLPVQIAVSEALRIAKKYSSYGSGKYLHAMIDSIYKGIEHDRKIVL